MTSDFLRCYLNISQREHLQIIKWDPWLSTSHQFGTYIIKKTSADMILYNKEGPLCQQQVSEQI